MIVFAGLVVPSAALLWLVALVALLICLLVVRAIYFNIRSMRNVEQMGDGQGMQQPSLLQMQEYEQWRSITGRLDVARARNSLSTLGKLAWGEFEKTTLFRPLEHLPGTGSIFRIADESMTQHWLDTRQRTWNGDIRPLSEQVRAWASGVIDTYFSSEEAVRHHRDFFQALGYTGLPETISSPTLLRAEQTKLRAYLADARNGFYGRFCVEQGTANLADRLTWKLRQLQPDDPVLYLEIERVRQMISAAPVQRFFQGILANNLPSEMSAVDAFTATVELRIAHALGMFNHDVFTNPAVASYFAENPRTGDTTPNEPALLDYLKAGMVRQVVKVPERTPTPSVPTIEKPTVPPPVGTEGAVTGTQKKREPRKKVEEAEQPAAVVPKKTAESAIAITEEDIKDTERWIQRNPALRESFEIDVKADSVKEPAEVVRRRLLEKIARAVKKEQKTIEERYGMLSRTRPEPVKAAWERQKNTAGILTCYIASVGNALRALGVYDRNRHSEEAMIRLLGAAQFIEKVRRSTQIGADTGDIEKLLEILAVEEGITFQQTASVADLLQSVEKGGAAILGIGPGHAGAIQPGERVFRQVGELMVQVIDPLSGERHIPVENLIKSEITFTKVSGEYMSTAFILRAPFR